MAADRLANVAKELVPPSSSSSSSSCLPQVDLLWRIAGYLFHKRWETREAAALALEKVGGAMDLAGLAHCLFGVPLVTEEEGGDQAVPPPPPPPTTGLLNFAGLDMARVLADGEPLLASTGEEYQLDAARENVSREELERQKAEIIKRLGLLEVPRDAKTRQAMERAQGGGGGDRLAGYGIDEEDLAANATTRRSSSSSSSSSRSRRKRNVADLGLAASGKEGGGEEGAAAAAAATTSTTTPTEQQENDMPWLAEHLSVRLFDATWETRHGAVLGLTRLFKTWRHREKKEEEEEKEAHTFNKEWVARWTEDVACRSLCLLALDRFADYSMGTTVAPIREAAGQLLGLVLFLGADHFPAALDKVKVLIEQGLTTEATEAEEEGRKTTTRRDTRARKRMKGSNKKAGDEEEEGVAASVLTWDVRHGGFVGLKYLVAVPSQTIRDHSHELLQWAAKGLSDSVDDVKEAAATTVLSILRQGNAYRESSDLDLVFQPVLEVLLSDDIKQYSSPSRVAGTSTWALSIPAYFQMAGAAMSAMGSRCDVFVPMFSLSFGIRYNKETCTAVDRRGSAAASSDVEFPLMYLLNAGIKCRDESLGRPALELLAKILAFWGDNHDFHAPPSFNDDDDENDGHKLIIFRNVLRHDKVIAMLCALVPPLLQALANDAADCRGSASKSPTVLANLEDVWKRLFNALGPKTVASLVVPITTKWLQRTYCLGPNEWGSSRRTAKALAQMRKAAQKEGQRMTQEALKAFRGQTSVWFASEKAALLLSQCYKLVKVDDEEENATARNVELATLWQELNAEDTKLEADKEASKEATIRMLESEETDEVRGHFLTAEETQKRRRFLTATATALVFGEASVEKPAIFIRVLMEAIKCEEDKEWLLMAVEALVHLCLRLLKEDKRKPVVKVMNNLCELATFCVDRRLPGLMGSREALKAFVSQDASFDWWKLPILMARIYGGIRIGSRCRSDPSEDAEENMLTTRANAEQGLRLLLLITPLVPWMVQNQPSYVSNLRLKVSDLVARATGDKEDDYHNSNLVNMLAARALSNVFKYFPRDCIAHWVKEVAALLYQVLQQRGTPREEDKRPRAAYCLLEIAKALTTEPLPLSYKDALPFLLPVALATVADDNKEVQLYGMESFQRLVELAPLLQPEDWVSVEEVNKKAATRGKEVENDATYMARESVMRLVLGNKAASRILGTTGGDDSVFSLPDALPPLLRGGLVLRPYQWDGVMWLTLLRRAGLHGALCDDMGLGKTLQALVALAVTHCEEKEDDKNALPSLVLCPASLAGHWYFESRRFLSPEAIETVQYASGLSAAEKAALMTGLGKRHLVVASYNMLRQDRAGLLTGQAWNHVIFDEVHVLRSGETTALGRAVKKLRARHRVALTGTPLQNQVQDIWAVFDILMPGLLGDRKTFEKEYRRPIGRASLRTANADATAEALAKLDKLHAHLLPFLLRREKGKVLQDLPPKTITDLACELVPLQRDMYEGHCQTQQAQGVMAGLQTLVSDANAAVAGGRQALQEQMGAQALRLLHYLRLLCVHPALVLQGNSAAREQLMGEVDCSGKMVALQNLLFACGVVTDYQEPTDNDNEEGGEEEEGEEAMQEEEEDDKEEEEGMDKTTTEDATTTLPPLVPPPSDSRKANAAATLPGDLHRCLIFAQHRITLDAIEKAILSRAHWNPAYGDVGASAAADGSAPSTTRYLRLDGSVPSGQREALVQRFNRDASIPIMLLTTRVGGLGLNLTGADVVIFVEHDWNPAVDLQAMDRAHRIGQGRPVNVYRLVTRNTVEEQVLALQRRKQGLADAVVTETNAQSFEARGMASVLDLVTASVGARGGAGGSAFDNGGGSGSGTAIGPVVGTVGIAATTAPSEEPWDENQYSAFAVDSFLANIIGEGGGTSGK